MHDYILSRGEVVAAVLDGAAYTDAAAAAGVSVSTAWRWVHRDAVNPPQRKPKIPAARVRKIRNMIDGGDLSLRRIAIVVGVHHSTVCKIRDSMTVGGYRSRPVRCRGCGAIITTQDCLLCSTRSSALGSSGFISSH
ncbi:helix-turn-helix domain-containing protein [Neorhodopirellula pilleata]|uniref:Uncharacterized protein n=1 Tax=Neorhodopirellula pilleata TaxID=2714738 RepID=A0A5C5ZWV6_9BACT|nr:helix-turn-helix domain-containing protein [Neorhodopirellula pilleata]TWT91408.1 hypothetical protein Pla100_52580 [Neorhodopirellula pilleata]TWT91457.1 hypothetical protein Pla100_53070 [Neorhodopirellula pilleata]